jgi:hypothetical protein
LLEELIGTLFAAWRVKQRPRLQSLWLHLAAVLLAMLGLLYLSFAVYLALAEQTSPPLAAALTAALLLLLAILLLLIAVILSRSSRRTQGRDEAADLAEALVRAGELFGHKVEHPSTSLAIVALAAGAMAGFSPSARIFLLKIADQLFKGIGGEPK